MFQSSSTTSATPSSPSFRTVATRHQQAADEKKWHAPQLADVCLCFQASCSLNPKPYIRCSSRRAHLMYCCRLPAEQWSQTMACTYQPEDGVRACMQCAGRRKSGLPSAAYSHQMCPCQVEMAEAHYVRVAECYALPQHTLEVAVDVLASWHQLDVHRLPCWPALKRLFGASPSAVHLILCACREWEAGAAFRGQLTPALGSLPKVCRLKLQSRLADYHCMLDDHGRGHALVQAQPDCAKAALPNRL